jgi:hypothetical protein
VLLGTFENGSEAARCQPRKSGDRAGLRGFAEEVDARYPYVGVNDVVRWFENVLYYFNC